MWAILSPPGTSVDDQMHRSASMTDAASHRKRFVRFLLVGALNTLFGFAVYSALIVLGTTIWLALFAGTLLGTVFNFFTTGGYVFRDISLHRFPRFVVCYLLLYGVNLVLLEWLSLMLGDKILSQAILILPMALLSFFLMARFVFSAK